MVFQNFGPILHAKWGLAVVALPANIRYRYLEKRMVCSLLRVSSLTFDKKSAYFFLPRITTDTVTDSLQMHVELVLSSCHPWRKSVIIDAFFFSTWSAVDIPYCKSGDLQAGMTFWMGRKVSRILQMLLYSTLWQISCKCSTLQRWLGNKRRQVIGCSIIETFFIV